MQEKIQQLTAEIENLRATAASEVEALRIKYLSKKGLISALFNDFRDLSV
ncbi:MAG: phenylalanine--tRNA ligase subunit alpha, partial [Muribaculaceae bacterium]|nr:phenylalanine--tRNA ligase subunit alpha [Muribaculaceae bacterium]